METFNILDFVFYAKLSSSINLNELHKEKKTNLSQINFTLVFLSTLTIHTYLHRFVSEVFPLYENYQVVVNFAHVIRMNARREKGREKLSLFQYKLLADFQMGTLQISSQSILCC